MKDAKMQEEERMDRVARITAKGDRLKAEDKVDACLRCIRANEYSCKVCGQGNDENIMRKRGDITVRLTCDTCGDAFHPTSCGYQLPNDRVGCRKCCNNETRYAEASKFM